MAVVGFWVFPRRPFYLPGELRTRNPVPAPLCHAGSSFQNATPPIMKPSIFKFLAAALLLPSAASAALITSTASTPVVGSEDIAHLGDPTSDTLNINGTGITHTNQNDAATYVANDRTTQGQTFTMSDSGTINGIWVKHVGFTTTLTNGTYSGLTDGTSISVRILSVSGTALTQIVGPLR